MRVRGDPRALPSMHIPCTAGQTTPHYARLHYTALHYAPPTQYPLLPSLSVCHIDTLPLSTHSRSLSHTVPRSLRSLHHRSLPLGGSAAALRPPRRATRLRLLPAALPRLSALCPLLSGISRAVRSDTRPVRRALPVPALCVCVCARSPWGGARCVFPPALFRGALPRCLRCLRSLCAPPAVRDIRGGAAGPGGASVQRA